MMKLSFAGGSIAEINGSILAYAATLGAVSSAPLAPPSPVSASTATAASSDGSATLVPASPASDGTGPVATNSASPSSDGVELDAAGVAWDANKHAGTKAKVASGLWRMKVGVKRAPGEGEDSPNYVKPGETAAAPSAPAVPAAPNTSIPAAPSEVPPPPPVDPMAAALADGWLPHPQAPGYHYKGNDVVADADVAARYSVPAAPPAPVDEFAAFATAAAPTARTWADADLSLLCNQAAQKAGSPDPVKAIIAKYIPEGVINHSREVPADRREEFARDVEATFGFQYAAA